MDKQSATPAVGMLLEQSLGHVSHGRNLQRSLADATEARVSFRELPYDSGRRRDRIPPLTNWTVRSGLAARAAVRDLQADGPLDALFVHTQVPAMLLGSIMDRLPTVVSVDATPLQIDNLGGSYNHPVHAAPLESLKWRVHRSTFRRASSLVEWSKWAADSLVDDYGVDRDRIDVIPPGVVLSRWQRPSPRTGHGDITRVLFVGGDFERKGGSLLLDAVAQLAHEDQLQYGHPRIELHLVTSAAVDAGPGVTVYRDLTPNSAELIELYHRCDVFALPTLGDCTPMVLAEAAAAGLPAIATDVGAIRETVLDGVTGHLVEPSVESVTSGLRKLVTDPDHRRRLGSAAAEHAARTMDAEANARRLLGRLVTLAGTERQRSRVWLTVSGEVPPDIREAIAAGERPVADYVAIADAAGAELLDRTRVRDEGSPGASIVDRLAGADVAMAFHLFRHRRAMDVVVTDGEQVGLPLAALLRVFGRRGTRHIMVGHRLSAPKKAIPTRLLGLHRGVDEVLVYSTSQLHVAQRLFNRGGTRIRQIDFMVDSEFFSPDPSTSTGPRAARPLLCTAGREGRDYPTLIEAVRDLDADVVIASASPWSKREDNAHDVAIPEHVTVTSLTQKELRDTLLETDVAVVPLQPTDFQAGITTILEAMSMSVPVVCTTTVGQIDVIEDGVNGRYVPPGDVAAMRTAITELLAAPDAAAAMGRRGRQYVETNADVRVYAEALARLVRWHAGVASPDHDSQDGPPPS